MNRFMMRLDPAWRPLLWVLGGAEPASFVEIDADSVRFKFGYAFDRTVPRSDIEAAALRDWPWWMGIGWRSNLRGLIGLIGSPRGVVEVQLRTSTRTWGVFPCDRIAVSLQDPEGFVEALSTAPVANAGPPPARAAKPAARPRATRKAPSTRAHAPKPTGKNGVSAAGRPARGKRGDTGRKRP